MLQSQEGGGQKCVLHDAPAQVILAVGQMRRIHKRRICSDSDLRPQNQKNVETEL